MAEVRDILDQDDDVVDVCIRKNKMTPLSGNHLQKKQTSRYHVSRCKKSTNDVVCCGNTNMVSYFSDNSRILCCGMVLIPRYWNRK